jgi:hypothetical protein
MRITGRDGVPMSLADAAQEVAETQTAVDTALDNADFVVTTIPRVQSPKAGETFTVSANPRGGAFDTPSAPNRESLYTYAWYADGAALGATGRAIARKAARSEVITVMVTDRHGRKRSGSCKVTVQAEPPPPAAPAAKTPPPAKSAAKPPAPPSTGRKLNPPPDALFDANPVRADSKQALAARMDALRARHRELKAQLDRSGGHDAAASREMTEVYREYMALKKRHDALK